MNKYRIEVSERYAKIIEVEAETEVKAIEKVTDMYIDEEVVLGNDDFVDNDFEVIEVIEEEIINKYETICLLNTTAKNEKINNVKKAMEDIVDSIQKIEFIGVRELAYEIRGNKEAFYIRAVVNGTPTNIAELEKYYRLNDNVLKFLTIKMED